MSSVTLLFVALSGFLIAHWYLSILWSVRRDGQSGMCCPFVGCAVFVVTPRLMGQLLHETPRSPWEIAAKWILLAIGAAVFLNLAIQIVAMTLEDRRRARERPPDDDEPRE